MNAGLIHTEDFRRIADLAYRYFGIHLHERKRQLVTNKFTNVLSQRGYDNWSAYIDDVENDKSGHLMLEFVDRLTTNHTYFFREADHFNVLRQYVLEPRTSAGEGTETTDLRIWCAGCASGEEAYSIAITMFDCLGEVFPLPQPSILATDISFSALKKAKEGRYDTDRLKYLSHGQRTRYFTQKFPGVVTVSEELRSAVLFKRLNFMSESYPFRNRFHAIFCRNVMIYFDEQSKGQLLSSLVRCLEPGGLLFIGHSETISARHNLSLQPLGTAVYRKEDAS